MDKKTELKINNLIQLRTLLTNTLIVLIGGTVGLLFVEASALKYLLLILGCFYILLFIANLSNTIREINGILYSEEGQINVRYNICSNNRTAGFVSRFCFF